MTANTRRLKQEELEARKRATPLVELRARLADLPAPASLPLEIPDIQAVRRRAWQGQSGTSARNPGGAQGSRGLELGGVGGLSAGQLAGLVAGSAGSSTSSAGLILPSSGSLLALPETGSLVWSLEASVEAELKAQETLKNAPPPRLQLIPELKGRPHPMPGPANLPPMPNLVTPALAEILDMRPPLALVWTDVVCYGMLPEQLPALHAHALERAEGQTPTAMVRADLLTDVWQIYESRVLGASGILLILEGLGRTQLEDLVGTARELSLGVWGYAHQAGQLEAVVRAAVDALVIGDSCLFEGEARRAPGVGPLRALATQLPADFPCLSLGGIRTADDLDIRALAGASALIAGRHWLRLQRTPGRTPVG